MQQKNRDLTIRSESIQSLYTLYLADRFVVNRRYQRKLVWTVEEKQKLIDSIQKDLPLPLVLVAEMQKKTEEGDERSLELIDGLQRLNAVFSFLENEYPVNGYYFDLDTLADTKLRKDEGELQQHEPKLPRDQSRAISNYAFALSVFRSADDGSIEEAFRRINSGGKRLSRHELRQAGAISPLSDLVRVLSSSIRNDSSSSDLIDLKSMPKLSITNTNLPYGVKVDDIFWVKNSILNREDIRQSMDEQLVLDLLIDCLVESLVTTNPDNRDRYFGIPSDKDDDGFHTPESNDINSRIETHGSDKIRERFLFVYDEIRKILEHSEVNFNNLMKISGNRGPRYFHALFIPLYEKFFHENHRIRDYQGIVETLKLQNITMAKGGRDWTSENKRITFNSLKGMISDYCEEQANIDNLGLHGGPSKLEAILNYSRTEQNLLDCKQGLLRLEERHRQFDENSFDRILKTLTAMHNKGPGAVGYVLLGIADTKVDADHIKNLDRIEPRTFETFHIVGINREARVLNKTENDYWQWVIQKLTTHTKIHESLASEIGAEALLIPYHGLSVGVLKVKGGSEPRSFGDELFERVGSETKKVNHDDYMRIYRRFFN